MVSDSQAIYNWDDLFMAWSDRFREADHHGRGRNQLYSYQVPWWRFFIMWRQDNAVIGDYIHIFPQVMAAQSEDRLVEMFGAGTAAVVSISKHF